MAYVHLGRMPWLVSCSRKILDSMLIIRDMLTKTWKLISHFGILDISNGYLMVKFYIEEDHKKVIEEGL